ncbi:MAG: hypothetical protein SO066_14885 [Proteus mirabilis]|nr:hypothetical protein [Proteus mirabilis]
MNKSFLSQLKKTIVVLYKSFSDLIHIVVTFILCYFCFLLSPTLAIAVIGSIIVIITMFLLSLFLLP